MSQCPCEEQLAAYAARACRADETAAIKEHVEHCAACRAWVERERQAVEWLDGVRQVAGIVALREPLSESTTPPSVPEPPSGTAVVTGFPQIPGCEITRELSRGGQGVVYEARQLTTKRTVAVKLLLDAAHHSSSASRRFEREVELVAQLHHPNIISVFQSGRLDNGLQYYVMEHVDGVLLHHYVRDECLSFEDALELFATVCGAVQHAHQHGVIHRDLKPTNILVDAEGQPRVLDFGLAKSLSSVDVSRVSVSREILGTLAYMSPEQAAGDSDHMDMRSDVYALGVILYELLTGHYPYPVGGSLPDVLRHITETTPAPPSRVWKPGSGVSRRTNRRLHVAECPIDADVQTILLKALAKEPDRRYQTVGDLARDIRHYLADEPIEARGDSAWYVVRKSLRRYRMAMVFAGAMLLVVTAALAVVTHLWQKAERQAALAEAGELATKLSCGLTSTGEAELGDHLANLGKLDAFLREHDTDALRNVIAERVDLEEQGLIKDVEVALAVNRLAKLADIFVNANDEPALSELLHKLDPQTGNPSLLARLRRRLERWIRVPPPLGRGQEMCDCLKMLLLLDPDNDRGREAGHAASKLLDVLPVVYADDFSQYDVGHVVDHWTQYTGVENCEIVEPEGGMLIGSTSTTSGAVRLALGPEHRAALGDVNVLSWVFSIRSSDLRHITNGDAIITMAGSDGLICQAGVESGHFEYMAPDSTGKWIIKRREPVEVDHEYCAELRYFRNRGTYDFLVDGEYLVEEAPCFSGDSVEAICGGPSRGVHMVIHQIELRSGDTPLKADLGPYPPVVDTVTLPLDAIRHVKLPCGSLVVHDFDDDGTPEVVMGDAKKEGGLILTHFRGERFECEVLGTRQLEAAVHVNPCSMVDGYLAVSGLGSAGIGAGDPQKGFALFEIGDDFSLTERFSRLYPQPGRAWVTPLEFPDGAHGFAVGLHERARAVELFRRSVPGAAEPYTRICRFTPHKPDRRHWSNVHSVLPLDRDGDGVDALAVGLGQWVGNCTAVVDLAAVMATATSTPTSSSGSHTETGPRNWVPAVPLTNMVGETLLAVSNLDTGTPYLIAASHKTRIQSDNPPDSKFTAGFGVHVWRVAPTLGRREIPPVFFTPCDALALAAGELCDQEVFAVVSERECEPGGKQILVAQVFGMRQGHVEPIWQATFYDVPWKCSHLCIADANGDGHQDLLLGLGQAGLFIFSPRTETGKPRLMTLSCSRRCSGSMLRDARHVEERVTGLVE